MTQQLRTFPAPEETVDLVLAGIQAAARERGERVLSWLDVLMALAITLLLVVGGWPLLRGLAVALDGVQWVLPGVPLTVQGFLGAAGAVFLVALIWRPLRKAPARSALSAMDRAVLACAVVQVAVLCAAARPVVHWLDSAPLWKPFSLGVEYWLGVGLITGFAVVLASFLAVGADRPRRALLVALLAAPLAFVPVAVLGSPWIGLTLLSLGLIWRLAGSRPARL